MKIKSSNNQNYASPKLTNTMRFALFIRYLTYNYAHTVDTPPIGILPLIKLQMVTGTKDVVCLACFQ